MTKVQIFTDKNQQGFLGFPNAVKANGLVFTSGVRSKPKKQKDRNFSGIPQEYREKEQRFSLVDEFEGKDFLFNFVIVIFIFTLFRFTKKIYIIKKGFVKKCPR